MSPFIIVFVFFEVDNLKSSDDHLYKLCCCFFIYYILASSFLLSVNFFFAKRGPEFKCCSSNFVIGTLACLSSDGTNIYEVKLNKIIFLNSDFPKTMKRVFLNVLIGTSCCFENFSHNVVSFSLLFKVWSSKWNTVHKCCNS